MDIDKYRIDVRPNLLLLLTAAIWGLAFVAQRKGMEFMGPFAFNGIRFAMGAAVLIPFISWQSRKRGVPHREKIKEKRLLFFGGVAAGILVFAGATFQQVGLQYTTAGNAGFITGLYMIFVPILGLALGKRTSRGTAVGAMLAILGLYFLSVNEDLTINRGDLLVLAGAVFWAVQVLVIGHFSPRTDSLKLAFVEFSICAALSMAVAFVIETITWQAVSAAAAPLLYGGVVSVGVAYTIQVMVQKKANPSHAAIIMGMEAVFAVLGGRVFLEEVLPPRGYIGCALMLAGMFVSQLWGQRAARRQTPLPT